jgi:hypothetical protein
MACIGRNARTAAGDHFGWHPSTGPDIDKRDGHIFVNNLLTGDKNFNRPLFFVWQPASLCDQVKNSQLKQLDNNVYVSGSNKIDTLILWSSAQTSNCQISFSSPADLQKLYPDFSIHCKYFPNYNKQLFKSSELGNYQLLETFPGSNSALRLPDEISKLLGQSKQYVGAYLPIK